MTNPVTKPVKLPAGISMILKSCNVNTDEILSFVNEKFIPLIIEVVEDGTVEKIFKAIKNFSETINTLERIEKKLDLILEQKNGNGNGTT